MLDPQRAVLIKRRNPFFRRHKIRVGAVGRHAHELEDCVLGGPLIPGCKRYCGCCGLSLRGGGAKQRRYCRGCRERLEQETTGQVIGGWHGCSPCVANDGGLCTGDSRQKLLTLSPMLTDKVAIRTTNHRQY